MPMEMLRTLDLGMKRDTYFSFWFSLQSLTESIAVSVRRLIFAEHY